VTDKNAERVLVVPTAVFHRAGLFQGLSSRSDYYLPRLLDPEHLSYRPRGEVETDPAYKQIVPYVVLKCGDLVFHYTRGKRATETRLHALRSIGVGGHISASDGSLFDTPYRDALTREVSEEVVLESAYEERCLGLINDDSTAVGQVHLGIAHVFELSECRVQRREQVLTRSGFASIGELHKQRAEFETWSQLVLDVLCEE
jgi:predicted NUDIX family phosphoesterase